MVITAPRKTSLPQQSANVLTKSSVSQNVTQHLNPQLEHLSKFLNDATSSKPQPNDNVHRQSTNTSVLTYITMIRTPSRNVTCDNVMPAYWKVSVSWLNIIKMRHNPGSATGQLTSTNDYVQTHGVAKNSKCSGTQLPTLWHQESWRLGLLLIYLSQSEEEEGRRWSALLCTILVVRMFFVFEPNLDWLEI